MRTATIHRLLAAAAVSLSFLMGSPVRAASISVCVAYGKEAMDAAQKVRELKCGFDLSNPQWSLEAGDHRGWCEKASNESVDHENVERRKQVSLCERCREYATLAGFQARQNKKMGCGFSGPAWNEDSEVHFGWCMGLNWSTHLSVFFGAGPHVFNADTLDLIDNEDAGRSQALEECRARQARTTCKICHGDSSQASSAPALLRKLPTGKSADKVGTSSARPTRAAIRSGTSHRDATSSGSDRVKAPSSGSSAIDRLSNTTSPASGAGGGDSDGGRGGGKSSSGAAGTSPGGSAGGGGAGVSTFRSPSNMVAPPPGGGLR